MPKKRHLNKYSKPQSTAPALLSSSAARRNDGHYGASPAIVPQPRPVVPRVHDASQARGVNELLADLRRAGLSGSRQRSPDVVQPTVPPAIRQILQIPETPPPRPRRPVRLGGPGRRAPAGPAPPPSWLSGSQRAENALRRTAMESGAARDLEHRPLPGGSLPARGSLIDMVLRRFVFDWEWQRELCHYHLYELPTHLRVALVAYLVTYTHEDVPEYLADPSLAPTIPHPPLPRLLARTNPHPNARLATFVSPHTGRNVPVSGTGPYSHSLDDDWAEAVLLLRRLSRSLYGLEYLV
ncbi:hypothetical protein N0V88_005085 [Collariella sp. IMI 366227]|nr:hypothetical protein N0V88_005085 [Collariella sp. IMI 366227]